MKNLLLLTLLAAATTANASQTPTEKMSKQERKAARAAKAPQVYKGTVAEQRRLVTDAPGAESDRDGGDGTTTKSGKKVKVKQ